MLHVAINPSCFLFRTGNIGQMTEKQYGHGSFNDTQVLR
jgi:hypothetical protein